MAFRDLRVGIAGWALAKPLQSHFPPTGTHLQRYAGVFRMVEINSSFYRPHKPETYRRWAESVPGDFRFAAKVPREITHFRRLRDWEGPLERFLDETGGLGEKRGPLLVQLPPSLALDAAAARDFFAGFRRRFPGPIACEPRHFSWFDPEAEALLREHAVARVAADPAPVPAAARPGGWDAWAYWRLHGSPKMYYSRYGPERLAALAGALRAGSARGGSYCVFDNTAEGHAIPDALALLGLLAPYPGGDGGKPASNHAATASPN